ncbi:MAG: tetratricopeptide repeat protein [Sphingobacteriia bacterium]|nr:tetratricopeptide repeat protein [Sphingobacteriia bacterium]
MNKNSTSYKTPLTDVLKRRISLFNWILFFFSVALYLNTLGHKYSLDDELNTHMDPTVAQGFKAIPSIFASPYRTVSGNKGELSFGYRPLPKATFAVEAGIFGTFPRALFVVSHLFNVLFYALSVVLLFLVLRRLFNKIPIDLIFLAALLFAAQPTHTEVVASLKNREEILAFLGGLGAFYFLIQGVDTNKWKYFLFAGLSFLGGYLSKNSILPFLFIYPLALYMFKGVSLKKTGFITIGLILLTVAIQFIPKLWLPQVSRPLEIVENPLFGQVTFDQRIGTGLTTLLHYLKMSVFPYPMSFYYGYDMIPVRSVFSLLPLVALVLYGGLFLLAIKGFKKEPVFAFSALFFMAAISMYSNIVSPAVGIVAERFLFLPTVGSSILIALLIYRLAGYKEEKRESSIIRSERVYAYAAIPLIVWAFMTVDRNSDWKTLDTLYAADIDHLDRSVKANTQFAGRKLYGIFNQMRPERPSREDVELMEKHLLLALKVKPDYYDALNNLGSIYSTITGQYEKSIPLFKRAIEVDPKNTAAYVNLAFAYRQTGKINEALETYSQVITIDPKKLKAYFKIAEIYEQAGLMQKAIEINERAMTADTTSEVPYINIGNYYIRQKDTTTAISYWEKAVEKQPLEQLSKNLSIHWRLKGDKKKSAYYAKKAEEAKGVVIIHK